MMAYNFKLNKSPAITRRSIFRIIQARRHRQSSIINAPSISSPPQAHRRDACYHHQEACAQISPNPISRRLTKRSVLAVAQRIERRSPGVKL